MWITETTPYQYGQLQNLYMADGPHYPGIPGNFGWLDPLSGDFTTLLSGYNVPPEMLRANYVTIGQIMSGLTGQRKGQWRGALDDSGTGRLARATWAPWTNDTFTNFHPDNPRLMIVPICEYLGGNGTNAQFRILRFGAFWLESIDAHGNDCTIMGRFIKYSIPGLDHGVAGEFSGLWTICLAR
jgi:hypothetical protein